MRVCAQIFEEDYFTHHYALYVPNNEARKWATGVLNKLKVNKAYMSRKYGFSITGDPEYIARYVGMINNDQYYAISNYMPYAPAGVELYCPSIAGISL